MPEIGRQQGVQLGLNQTDVQVISAVVRDRMAGCFKEENAGLGNPGSPCLWSFSYVLRKLYTSTNR